jgi:hypothetical protein
MVLEAGKCTIKALADTVPAEGSLSGSENRASLCPHMTEGAS